MQGPYPIFCRGHSGGRILCEAFIHNGIDMGKVAPDRKDTEFFSIHNPLIYELTLNAYHYITATLEQKKYFQQLMQQCLGEYIAQEIKMQPFGWKMGMSLFMLPVVLDTFPHAKVIHLIRDGRDVMLSRLEARFGGNNLANPLNQLLVFGHTPVTHFAGQSLTSETIAAYRNELEILHWVTAVNYGLQGRQYPERYLEVKYETLCQDPITTCEMIFDFLQQPFLTTTKTWLKQAVHGVRIGKWRNLPAEQLEKPLSIAGELLKKLNYPV